MCIGYKFKWRDFSYQALQYLLRLNVLIEWLPTKRQLKRKTCRSIEEESLILHFAYELGKVVINVRYRNSIGKPFVWLIYGVWCEINTMKWFDWESISICPMNFEICFSSLKLFHAIKTLTIKTHSLLQIIEAKDYGRHYKLKLRLLHHRSRRCWVSLDWEPRIWRTKCSFQGFRPPRLIGPLCQYLAQSPCYYIQYASHCLPSANTNTPPSTAGLRRPKKLCQIICWLALPPTILSANCLNDLFRVVFLKQFVLLYPCLYLNFPVCGDVEKEWQTSLFTIHHLDFTTISRAPFTNCQILLFTGFS